MIHPFARGACAARRPAHPVLPLFYRATGVGEKPLAVTVFDWLIQAIKLAGRGLVTRSSGAARSPGSDLAVQLEQAFRLLGKRIYLPSVRQMRAVNPGLDKASIPLLATLGEQDDVRPSDVAAAAELDPSTVSRQLHQLERLGLVSRRPDGGDGRASRISLTVQGRDSLALVRASRAAMLDTVFRGWPDEDRRHLLRLLDRLLVGLAALPATASPPPSKESHS
jgi:DNA-binding MarR family transcriptional regulator